MAQRQGSTAVADAPDTLPSDFFDKKQSSGKAPDTLPANFFEKPVADDGMYHGEEEATPANDKESKVQQENLTPRMRAAISTGAAKMQPPTQFEKDRPGEGISLKGAGGAFWDKLKQMVSSDPTGGRSVLDPKFWYNPDEASLDPAHGSLVQAGGEAAHEYERARKAGSGIIPSIGTAGVVGAGSLLGVSNKEEEEQAERGEGGKIIGGAAAPAAAAAVAPLVGPALETGARGLRAGLIQPIKGALADRFATPAVAPGLSDAATANLEEPVARRGTEKLLRSSGMPSGQPGLRESFSLAAPDLKAIEEENPLGKSGTKGGIIRPDMRLRQTVENIDNRLDHIWKEERQPQIDRNAELPALSREQLLGDASIDQLKRIEKTFKMDIPEQITLGDADKMLVKVNARLRRAEGMTPEARALALELSPDLQKFNEMKGELHQSIGGLLERVNEPGIKEFNRRYGALSEVRDALRNRMNPVEAERVLDSIRATGGLGRNINLFERLHLKASPGRLAQKGLEDLSRSNLDITPPVQRPPVAGLLPPIPEPLGNGPDTSGATNLPVPEGHQVVPVPGGRYVRGLLPGPVPAPPEPPPTAPPPVGGKYRIEPIGSPADANRIGMRGEQGVRIPDIKMLPETATAVPQAGALPFNKPLEPLPNAKPILPAENVARGTIPEPEPAKPVRDKNETNAIRAELSEYTQKAKKWSDKIANARPSSWKAQREWMDNLEAADKRVGELKDALEKGTPIKLGRRGATREELTVSYRNLSPEIKAEVDDLASTFSNMKDAYAKKHFSDQYGLDDSRLKGLPTKEKLARFVTRDLGNTDAANFIKSLENPDAEPPEPEAQQAAPKPTKPLIPNIGKGETGIIPGMEQDVAKQNEGAAKVAGEKLTGEINTPKDISAAAGRMETHSPLFRGTEASPQKEIFANRPTPEPNAPPPPIQQALEGTSWTYEGKNNLGLYTIKEPGTNIKLSLFERELNPDFIRRKIAEKEKQYGAPAKGKGKPKQVGGEEVPF